MKQEVVQDFLNLPGIIGVALLSARSRPYFCGVDRLLNFQQRAALAQGIQQVIDTTPVGFESFEFQFNGHRVHLYKLDHGLILLVLALDRLADTAHLELVARLRLELGLELQTNIADAIETFRQLAEASPFFKASEPQAAKQKTPELSPALPSVMLSDLLAALNQLSRFGTQYLGATVVIRNWQMVRPDIPWLSQFQIDRKGHFSFSGQMKPTSFVSLAQQQQVQQWAAAFIDRCSQIIRTFPKTVRQKGLDIHQQALLLPDS
jgi:hypothetical protein